MPRRIAIELDAVLAEPAHAPWDAMKEREAGAVSRLAKIAAARRWDVIFLTRPSRPSHTTEQVDAQRWLEASGFVLPSVFVASGARGRIASALHLDLVIDAEPDDCVNVVSESDSRALLVWPDTRGRLPAEARRPEIVVAKSFAECLDMLTVVDDPGARRESVFARVKRLLGLEKAKA